MPPCLPAALLWQKKEQQKAAADALDMVLFKEAKKKSEIKRAAEAACQAKEKDKEPEAKGERLLDGMLERETVVVGMVRYAKRFAVLFSDPFLGMYDAVDQTKAVKGGRSLVG